MGVGFFQDSTNTLNAYYMIAAGGRFPLPGKKNSQIVIKNKEQAEEFTQHNDNNNLFRLLVDQPRIA